MPKSKVFNYEVSDKLKEVLRTYGLTDIELMVVMIELEVIQQFHTYLTERISDESKRS